MLWNTNSFEAEIVNSTFFQKNPENSDCIFLNSLSLKTFNSAIPLSNRFGTIIPKTMWCSRSCFHLFCNFSLGKFDLLFRHIKVGSKILAHLSTVEPSALFSNNFACIAIMNHCALISVMMTRSFCFSLLMVSSIEKPILILLTLRRYSSLARSISIDCFPFSHFSMI